MEFLNELGRRISSVSGEDRESAFLFQRISVLSTFNASIVCFCTILLLTTIQSCSHSITFVFNFCF